MRKYYATNKCFKNYFIHTLLSIFIFPIHIPKMKAEGASKKLATFYKTARHHVLDDSNLQGSTHPGIKNCFCYRSQRILEK
jgi:hypothetical protein